MAKVKIQKETKNGKSHLKARSSYLQLASEYLHNLTLQNDQTATTVTSKTNNISSLATESPVKNGANIQINTNSRVLKERPVKRSLNNLSRLYISQMRGVSLKSQTRLEVPVKRSFCKRCDTILTPGINCIHEVQNASRERKKPWADVLVIRCLVCDTEKRFPQTDRRSQKLKDRQKESNQEDKPLKI
ncbi:hypothetical protein N7495_007534 [Penicillium taxi]|uniref:uncharacterized protein n=1 Tax=Penicillium taxi TaxID=168475 RepID=UPI002544D6A0|nr:uncharacterized protein N7495_007534 [Penicillium taxi]KAJ5887493.1 hypothetical protein N7495_007534 [Penicillium taxi]